MLVLIEPGKVSQDLLVQLFEPVLFLGPFFDSLSAHQSYKSPLASFSSPEDGMSDLTKSLLFLPGLG